MKNTLFVNNSSTYNTTIHKLSESQVLQDKIILKKKCTY